MRYVCELFKFVVLTFLVTWNISRVARDVMLIPLKIGFLVVVVVVKPIAQLIPVIKAGSMLSPQHSHPLLEWCDTITPS